MWKVISSAVLSIALIGCAPVKEENVCEFPPREVLESVVRVDIDGTTRATAFSVLDGSVYLGAGHTGHATKGAFRIREDFTTETRPVGHVYWDKEGGAAERIADKENARDYMIFTSGLKLKPLKLRKTPPKRYEKVVVIGYAMGEGLIASEGRLQGKADNGTYVVNATMINGMSGGPTLTCSQENGWEVVGVNSYYRSLTAPLYTPMGAVPMRSAIYTYGGVVSIEEVQQVLHKYAK